MSRVPPTDASPTGEEGEIARLCEEISDRLRHGETVDIEDYEAQWPHHADELRQLLPAMQMMAELKIATRPAAADAGTDRSEVNEALGDFRLVREIGRGGMGVVYEAQQLSLRRSVALKVLPFASVLDSVQLRRFQKEAQAAAMLHHPQIVPVFGVGCDRGVHYYAMQLINGPTLADVIRQLRSQAGLDSPHAMPVDGAARGNSRDNDAVTRGPGKPDEDGAALGAERKSSPSITGTLGILSTSRNHRSWSFIRAAVQLGIDVAEALDYAHREGVLHRDIKPGNLLLGERGQVWVTDFGLARVESDPALTATGDLVGTLRYMSPEQALGDRIAVDHRTDIYSLGATLYELLTLQPVFAGEDRQTLLRQVAFEEPRRLRQVERRLPAALETILLKALAKSPPERYATAGALAEDLRRFLEQKPIRARRPSLLDRGAKWALRNRHVMAVGTAGLLVAVVTLAVANLLIWREQHKTRHALDVSVAERSKADRAGKRMQELAADLQRHLYVSKIRLIEQFARSNQRGRLTAQLNELRESAGHSFVRGFEWYYWWHQGQVHSLLVLPGHQQDVEGLAFFPDGRRFATGAGRLVQIWDLTTGSVLQELRAPYGNLMAVAISPDGNRLASANKRQRHLFVWDLIGGRLTHDLDADMSPAFEPRFWGDGNTLFFTDWTGIGEWWDLTSGTQTRTLEVHAPSAAMTDPLVPGAAPAAYAWSRDSQRVATGALNDVVRIVDLDRGMSVLVHILDGRVLALRFTPDEKRLVCATDNGLVRVMDIDSLQLIHSVKLPLSTMVCADFDMGGERLVTIDEQQQGQVWNVRTGECLATVPGLPARMCRFADDSRCVVAIGPEGFVGVWRPFVQSPINPAGHARETWSVAFSPDGQRLASGSDDETVRLWNVCDGSEQRILRGHEATVTGVAFSPDGTTLASASLDGSVRLWRVADGAALRTLLGHPLRVTSVAFSPTGTWLVSGGDELVVWDPSTGQVVTELFGNTDERINGLCFSPDGKHLAVASSSNLVHLLDTRDWRVLQSLDHVDQVWSVDFSPDGRMLATGDKVGNVSRWSLAEGRPLAVERAHTGYVRAVRFTRDGRTLASAGDDQRIVLWDPVTMAELCTLQGHSDLIYALSFAPDDSILASGSYDGAIRFWHAPRGE
ncbi:MAG: WD40 repeat domain-containing serine/threonine protein kinase [Pirellulaceae bacterium]